MRPARPANTALDSALHQLVKDYVQYVTTKRSSPFRCVLYASALDALSLAGTAAELQLGEVIGLEASRRATTSPRHDSTPRSSSDSQQASSPGPMPPDRMFSFSLEDHSKDCGDYAATRPSSSSSGVSEYHPRTSLASDSLSSTSSHSSNGSSFLPRRSWLYKLFG